MNLLIDDRNIFFIAPTKLFMLKTNLTCVYGQDLKILRKGYCHNKPHLWLG